ncbi:MAG: undecaprenyl diphosphate synthase family protein, partial [Candidatus Dormibacteria bacterium]
MGTAVAESARDGNAKRLPQHVGIIPDGNRRWAQGQGFEKQDGYHFGVQPGLELYSECLALGIPE